MDTYNLKILLAVVNQRECEIFPGSLSDKDIDILPLEIPLQMLKRYFFSVLNSFGSIFGSSTSIGSN